MSRAMKRGLLFYWALWFTVVCLTNVFDNFKGAGWLDEGWLFASGNLTAIAAATAIYDVPSWLPTLLHVGVILLQALIAALFWASAIRFGREVRGIWGSVEVAFIAAFALWGGFLLAGEVFIFYAFGATHTGLFMAQALSLLLIRLLPERSDD